LTQLPATNRKQLFAAFLLETGDFPQLVPSDIFVFGNLTLPEVQNGSYALTQVPQKGVRPADWPVNAVKNT
jgi:hypothetical protein